MQHAALQADCRLPACRFLGCWACSTAVPPHRRRHQQATTLLLGLARLGGLGAPAARCCFVGLLGDGFAHVSLEFATPATTAKRPIPFVRGAGWAPRRAGPIRGATCVDIGLRVHEGDIGLAPQRGHEAPPHTCCQLPLARPCGAKPPPRGLCHVHPKSPRQQATSTFGLALASGAKAVTAMGREAGDKSPAAGQAGDMRVSACASRVGALLAMPARAPQPIAT